jgi:hypothetical protein
MMIAVDQAGIVGLRRLDPLASGVRHIHGRRYDD